MFDDIFNDLKQGFNQSWSGFLFKYTALGRLLTQENSTNQADFLNTYLTSWWWNRLWFRACIQSPNNRYEFNNIIRDVASSLNFLKKAGMLNDANLRIVSASYVASRIDLTPYIYILNSAGILNDASLRIVARALICGALINEALSKLIEAGILNDENLREVCASYIPSEMASALCHLNSAGILNDENLRIVSASYDPSNMASALCHLNSAGILNDANLRLVAAYFKPYYSDFCSALNNLNKAKILNDANLALVVAHAKGYSLALALNCLNDDRILDDANRTIVAAHAKPHNMALALSYLNDHGLLNDKNRTLAAAHDEPSNLVSAIIDLNEAGILNDVNLALVFNDPFTDRLAIPGSFKNEEGISLSVFNKRRLILIMTTKESEFERISNLIPNLSEKRKKQLKTLYAEITDAQYAVLIDVFSVWLEAVGLSYDNIRLIQEYVGPLNEWNKQVPLPFYQKELPQYSEQLNQVAKQFKPSQQDLAQKALEDKLNRVVNRANQAIANQTPAFFKTEPHQSKLIERLAQIEAAIKLISWLGDHTKTFSVKELALLGQQKSIRLILEKNALHLPKITWLNNQFHQAEGYNQERHTLSTQKFLLSLEKNSLWARRQASPKAHHDFDSQHGLIPYTGAPQPSVFHI